MTDNILHGVLLDEHVVLTLEDLSSACSSSTEWVIELVEIGALDPLNYPHADCSLWVFSADSLKRAHTAMRLQRDLGVNLAGLALALELLEKIEKLESRLRTLDSRRTI